MVAAVVVLVVKEEGRRAGVRNNLEVPLGTESVFRCSPVPVKSQLMSFADRDHAAKAPIVLASWRGLSR